jgi:hypothetical protein
VAICYCAMWHDLTPSKINYEDPLCFFINKNNYYVAMWHFVMGHNIIVNNGDSSKPYMDSQWMRVYILIVYIIHVKCDDIMLNHHLLLDFTCDFSYATNGF